MVPNKKISTGRGNDVRVQTYFHNGSGGVHLMHIGLVGDLDETPDHVSCQFNILVKNLCGSTHKNDT